MKHFTNSASSSKSTDFDTNLTPIQAAAAIALGFGLEIPAVAAELKIHSSTLYNWAKNPFFFKSVETAHAQFEKQFRTQIAMLTRLALTNIQQILADTEASPSVRLKAALAVLKQDWKFPRSTDFDTLSQPNDSLRNETVPGHVDAFRHHDSNEINNVRNEMPPNRTTNPNPSAATRSAATSPAPAAPTSSTSAAAESEVRHFSTL